jgi:hypothetical protein
LINGSSLADDFERMGIGATAGKEDLDDESIRFRDKMLR